MPYIKKKYRPIFDQAVFYALDHQTDIAKEMILFGIKYIKPDGVDGCLNYAFTQLLRKVELDFAEQTILFVVMDYFIKEQSYGKLERMRGLFDSMRDEFRRRDWVNDNNMKIIKQFYHQACFEMFKLEPIKQIENGDLD